MLCSKFFQSRMLCKNFNLLEDLLFLSFRGMIFMCYEVELCIFSPVTPAFLAWIAISYFLGFYYLGKCMFYSNNCSILLLS